MIRIFAIVLMALAATAPAAQEAASKDAPAAAPLVLRGETADLKDFLWVNRPLVVFADTPADPRYIQQMEYLLARPEALAARDVVVLTDTDPAAKSALRKTLRPRGFMLVLIGKDGIRYLRKPFPWDVREITRVIDKLPMRQQEIREGRGDS